MLKKYRNVLYEAILEKQLSPRDFTPSDTEEAGSPLFQLQFRDTGLKFQVRAAPGSREAFDCRWSLFSPGFPLTQWFPLTAFTTFEIVLDRFGTWVDEEVLLYLEELELPDLWGNLQGVPSSTTSLDETSNAPFTPPERERIKDSLRRLHSDAESNLTMTPEQLKALSGRIEYLIEASERLGKKDWLSAATGALIGFAIEASLSSSVAREFLGMADSALRWILDTPLLLP